MTYSTNMIIKLHIYDAEQIFLCGGRGGEGLKSKYMICWNNEITYIVTLPENKYWKDWYWHTIVTTYLYV